MTRVRLALLLSLTLAMGLLGCNVDLNVDDRVFTCSTDADCGAGFVCQTGRCVSLSSPDTTNGDDLSEVDTSEDDTSAADTTLPPDTSDRDALRPDTTAMDTGTQTLSPTCEMGDDIERLYAPLGTGFKHQNAHNAAVQAAGECVAEAGFDPGALVDCLEGYDLPLSRPCLGCFAGLTLCAVNNCASQCGDDRASSAACAACLRDSSCLDGLQDCIGVPCSDNTEQCGPFCPATDTSQQHCGECFNECTGQCSDGVCDSGRVECADDPEMPRVCLDTGGRIRSRTDSLIRSCLPAGTVRDGLTYCETQSSCDGLDSRDAPGCGFDLGMLEVGREVLEESDPRLIQIRYSIYLQGMEVIVGSSVDECRYSVTSTGSEASVIFREGAVDVDALSLQCEGFEQDALFVTARLVGNGGATSCPSPSAIEAGVLDWMNAELVPALIGRVCGERTCEVCEDHPCDMGAADSSPYSCPSWGDEVWP